jgi:hypothetical protein
MGTANRWHLVAVYRSLLLLAGGLALLGQRLSVPFLINLGLLCLGLMLVIMGGELIITRRAEFAIGGFAYIQAVETFTGLAAQLWGVMFLGVGLAMIVAILARWLAPEAVHGWYSGLVGTRAGLGLALCALGLFAGLWGTIRLLAGSAGLDLGRMTRLSNIVDRVGGGIALLAGLGLLGAGVLLIVAPGTVASAWAKLWIRILQR